jgi:hypothetical protein
VTEIIQRVKFEHKRSLLALYSLVGRQTDVKFMEIYKAIGNGNEDRVDLTFDQRKALFALVSGELDRPNLIVSDRFNYEEALEALK